ncbi:hypothetical protein ACJMK2_022029 [Sinanodonta woodiana]|uniref:Uncharacterized protein n=1 Tax=Sinanodonta woodiana TaxID=1069815 RepID=A0ABD3TIJ4_SINWO
MQKLQNIPVEGVDGVVLMVDVEVLMVEGVPISAVPEADGVENGVVLVPVWGVITVDVPVELLGKDVLDNGFVVVPKYEEVIMVSI